MTVTVDQAREAATLYKMTGTPVSVAVVNQLCNQIEALQLAIETERSAANMYAKQVAHWIEKHDALLAQQLETVPQEWNDKNVIAWCVARGIKAAQPVAAQGEPTGCACRWDADDNRVATCERHQGWLDVVHEWAERAKTAESALQSTQPLRELSDEEIKAWWASENGLEDANMACLKDFTEVVRAVLKKARGE